MSLRDHLEKIRYFQAVCEAGTFRKAALQLRLSQSSLTVAVKKLEGSIGNHLLVRSKRGVRPTAAGEVLLTFARDLSAQVDDIAARLRAPHDVGAGRLRIGAYDSIAVYLLPKVLTHLHQKFPNLHLSVAVGSSSVLIERVKAGDADIALVVAPPDDVKLKVTELFRDRFGFYATPAKVKELDLRMWRPQQDLEPVIGALAARVTTGSTLADVLREKGFNMHGSLEVESFEIAKALALQSVGVAILPHRVAEFGEFGKKLVRLNNVPQGFGAHRICLVSRDEADARGSLTRLVCQAVKNISVSKAT